MKNALKAMLIAGVVGSSALAAAPADAYPARSGVSVYFNTGNVAVGYRDGYYDHHRRWHRWANHRDWIAYRNHPHARYYDRNYDRRHPYRW